MVKYILGEVMNLGNVEQDKTPIKHLYIGDQREYISMNKVKHS
jgi:hypothetical protein